MHSWRKPIIIFVVGISVALRAGPARAGIISINPSEGTTLAGGSQTFSWTGTGITEYWLYVGRTQGAKDIYNSGSLGLATSETAKGLPTDGSTVWVRLWHGEGGTWLWNDFSYTSFTTGGGGGTGDGNHTLRWDQILPAAERFVLVMGGDGVLDKETGLVWEQEPVPGLDSNWQLASLRCLNRDLSGRRGWRVPSVHELASLVDTNQPPGNADPNLPPGHPFSNVQLARYWTGTTSNIDPILAFVVHFGRGDIDTELKSSTHFLWCVRGGGILSAH